MTKRSDDPATRQELRALRRAHPALAEDADAQRQMERLASLRLKFRQLDAAIQKAGGASEASLELVAELRQVSRACSTLEAQLRRWFIVPSTQDPFALLAETRRALLSRPTKDAVIDAVIEAPIGAQLLRVKREQN